MKKKGTTSQLRREADIIFSHYIRLRETMPNLQVRCYTCGVYTHWTEAQCSHFIDRRYAQFRYDPKFARPSCKYCNETLDGNREVFRRNLVVELGAEEVERAESQKNEIYQMKHADFEKAIAHLKLMVKEIKEKLGL